MMIFGQIQVSHDLCNRRLRRPGERGRGGDSTQSRRLCPGKFQRETSVPQQG